MVINTEDKPMDHWLRIKNPETDPYLYGQIIYDKEYITEQWDWKKLSFKSMGQGQLILRAEKRGEKKTWPYLMPNIKNQFKVDYGFKCER